MLLNSENINEIASALAKAQAEMTPPEKDKRANYGQYASLGSVISSSKPALNKYGLCVSQQIDNSKDVPCIVSTLMHSSGQWIRSYMPIPIGGSDGKGNPLQQFGGKLTYLKRYAMTALLSIDADEDDDGVQGGKIGPVGKETPRMKIDDSEPKEVVSGVITDIQVAELRQLIGDNVDLMNRFTSFLVEHFKVDKFEDIPLELFPKLKADIIRSLNGKNR